MAEMCTSGIFHEALEKFDVRDLALLHVLYSSFAAEMENLKRKMASQLLLKMFSPKEREYARHEYYKSPPTDSHRVISIASTSSSSAPKSAAEGRAKARMQVAAEAETEEVEEEVAEQEVASMDVDEFEGAISNALEVGYDVETDDETVSASSDDEESEESAFEAPPAKRAKRASFAPVSATTVMIAKKTAISTVYKEIQVVVGAKKLAMLTETNALKCVDWLNKHRFEEVKQMDPVKGGTRNEVEKGARESLVALATTSNPFSVFLNSIEIGRVMREHFQSSLLDNSNHSNVDSDEEEWSAGGTDKKATANAAPHSIRFDSNKYVGILYGAEYDMDPMRRAELQRKLKDADLFFRLSQAIPDIRHASGITSSHVKGLSESLIRFSQTVTGRVKLEQWRRGMVLEKPKRSDDWSRYHENNDDDE